MLSWKDYFLTGKVEKNAPNYIQEASKLIQISHFSKEERMMIDNLEKAREDAIARELYSKRIGKEEGREEVIQEISELLKKGYTGEKIMEMIKAKK